MTRSIADEHLHVLERLQARFACCFYPPALSIASCLP